MMQLQITRDSHLIDWYLEHFEERMEPNTQHEHKNGNRNHFWWMDRVWSGNVWLWKVLEKIPNKIKWQGRVILVLMSCSIYLCNLKHIFFVFSACLMGKQLNNEKQNLHVFVLPLVMLRRKVQSSKWWLVIAECFWQIITLLNLVFLHMNFFFAS